MSTRKTSTVGLNGQPLEFDADENWKSFLAMPPKDQIVTVADTLHFAVHLRWMGLTHQVANRFAREYYKPQAIRNRHVAVSELIEANHIKEWMIYSHAKRFRDVSGAGNLENCDAPENPLNHMARRIALDFSEILASGDVPALRRIIKIIEAGGIPAGKRGGDDSETYQMLANFRALHVQSRSLPTKKQLREACDLNEESCKKLAADRMKKLGLWGLPTEAEI